MYLELAVVVAPEVVKLGRQLFGEDGVGPSSGPPNCLAVTQHHIL